MTTGTQGAPSSSSYSAANGYGQVEGHGWLTFAAIMLGLAGTWNFIVGLLAIGDSKVYGANIQFIFSDLRTWGWIVLLLGVLQIMAALTVLAGSDFARWFGIGVAGLNALGQLAYIPIYPWWAISMFVVDLLIIYGLSVYGGSKMLSRS